MSRIHESGPNASPGLYQITEHPKECPHCGSAATRVIKTVPYEHMRRIRRRRQCLSCGHTYYTWSDSTQ